MRKIWTTSMAATGTAAALVLGTAGMASADTGEHTDTDNHVETTDTRIEDSGNVTLDDILNGTVDLGDVGIVDGCR